MGKGKLCETCQQTRASYGYPGGKRVSCATCKKDGMVDCMTKMCERCHTIAATFGFSDGKHTHCKSCKLDGMVDVKNKKKQCVICHKKQANYGLTKPTHCASCKTLEMTDLLTKKCCVCMKVCAKYGINRERTHCVKCKLEGMISDTNLCKKCNKKQPSFGNPGQKAEYCKDCKNDNMVDLLSKMCSKCKKVNACFGYEGKKYTHCGTCKLDGMTNIKDKIRQCKNSPCPTRGNKKYRGYCTHCFQHLFPTDPLSKTIYCKTKESKVKTMLIHEGYEFIHDKSIQYGGCDCSSRRRVDFWKLIGNTILAIEVDENQHKSYDKKDEEARYNDLFLHHSGKWVFIRFNPDSYKKNGVRVNPRMETRLPKLKEAIDCEIKRIQEEANEHLLEVHTLYFDS